MKKLRKPLGKKTPFIGNPKYARYLKNWAVDHTAGQPATVGQTEGHIGLGAGQTGKFRF